MKELYLHIGFPKTGTTFLQLEIFPKLKDVNFLDPCKQKFSGELSRFMADLATKKLSDKKKEEISVFFKQKVSKQKNLLSFESLCGRPYNSRKTRIDILKDIKSLLKDFKIKSILGVRNQTEIITSMYIQHLHEGGYKSFFDFIQENGKNFSFADPFFSFFKYGDFIDLLVNLFGRKNVYVYSYADFKNDKKKFLAELCDFLGEQKIPVFEDKSRNKSFGKLQVKLARFLNRFFKSSRNPAGLIPIIRIPGIGKLSPRNFLQFSNHLYYKRYKMPSLFYNKIKELYEEDNKSLKKYGIELDV